MSYDYVAMYMMINIVQLLIIKVLAKECRIIILFTHLNMIVILYKPGKHTAILFVYNDNNKLIDPISFIELKTYW